MRSPTQNPPELTADVRVPRKYGKRERTAPNKIINFLLFESYPFESKEQTKSIGEVVRHKGDRNLKARNRAQKRAQRTRTRTSLRIGEIRS